MDMDRVTKHLAAVRRELMSGKESASPKRFIVDALASLADAEAAYQDYRESIKKATREAKDLNELYAGLAGREE